MARYQLAQINVAHALAPMTSPIMKGFVDQLEIINALADQSPGFIWRLQTEDGDATAIQLFEDPNMIVNMSVWQDLESLRHYVYKSAHVELIRKRQDWFTKMSEPHQALWWVPTGHVPTVEEGRERLAHLQTSGPSEFAFTFAKPFGKSRHPSLTGE